MVLFLAPGGSATTPSAPPTLIIDVLDFNVNSTTGIWDATLNVSFMRAPEDPGTWHYTLNASPDLSVCSDAACYNQATYDTKAFAGDTNSAGQRAGWAWLTTLATFGGSEDICSPPATCANTPVQFWGQRNFTLWANESGNSGSPSCVINIDLKKFDLAMYQGPNGIGTDGSFNSLSHKIPNEAGTRPYYACGTNTTLRSVAGLQAIVLNSYNQSGATRNVTGTSTTNITWHPSPDDTNFSLDYYVLKRYNDPPAPTSLLIWARDLPSDGDDTPTLHSHSLVGDGTSGALDPMWVSMLTRDPRTHQQSQDSCIVSVVQGKRNSAAGCGDLTLPFTSQSSISPVPVFPMLEPCPWSASLGLTCTTGSLALGTMFVLISTLLGLGILWKHSPMIGGSGGFAVGFLGAVTFGLYQPWTLFLMVSILVGIILLYPRPNGGTQE